MSPLCSSVSSVVKLVRSRFCGEPRMRAICGELGKRPPRRETFDTEHTGSTGRVRRKAGNLLTTDEHRWTQMDQGTPGPPASICVHLCLSVVKLVRKNVRTRSYGEPPRMRGDLRRTGLDRATPARIEPPGPAAGEDGKRKKGKQRDARECESVKGRMPVALRYRIQPACKIQRSGLGGRFSGAFATTSSRRATMSAEMRTLSSTTTQSAPSGVGGSNSTSGRSASWLKAQRNAW